MVNYVLYLRQYMHSKLQMVYKQDNMRGKIWTDLHLSLFSVFVFLHIKSNLTEFHFSFLFYCVVSHV